MAERAGKKDLWENSELAAAATPIESALVPFLIEMALSHSSRSEAFPIMQRRSFEACAILLGKDSRNRALRRRSNPAMNRIKTVAL